MSGARIVMFDGLRDPLFWGFLVLMGASLTSGANARLVAEVKDHKGSPMIHANGKPISPLMLFAWPDASGPSTVTLSTEWQQYSVTFIAPEDNDTQAGVHFRVGGDGPGTVWVDDVQLHPGEKERDLQENRIRQGDWEGTKEEISRDWNFFQAEYAGAKAEWDVDPFTQVRGKQSLRISIQDAGDTTMHLHFHQTGLSVKKGETYTYSLWMKADRRRTVDFMALRIGEPWTLYGGANPFYSELTGMTRKAGVHLYTFCIPLPWPRPGELPDFTGVDRILEIAVKSDPDALLLPRFEMGPPSWWLEAHPQDRMLFEDGKTEGCSMASEAWRRDMETPLRELVRHCEETYGDHMLGYHPCGQHTGEWFYYRSWEPVLSDFSSAMDSGFSQWAAARYGGLGGIQKAWHEPDLTLEAIRVPTPEEQLRTSVGFFRDPEQERKVIDYFAYKQLAMEEPLERMARIIKEETRGRKLVCFFYGYLFDMHGLPRGPQGSGHLALSRLVKCPDVDILCSPISYLDREQGGAGCFMTPVDTVRTHGKLWLNEDDTRTYLARADAAFGKVDSPQATLWVHERNFGQLWPRRLAAWYMDLENAGWLNGEDLWENIARFQEYSTRHLRSRNRWAPEVALIVDEESPFYTACTSALHLPLVYEMRSQFFRMGTSFRIHLLSDLVAGQVPDAKVYFFPNSFHLEEKEREAIREATEGKTAVWFYGGGFLGDHASEENMSITGLRLTRGTPQPGMIQWETSPWTEGLKGPAGRETLMDPLWSVSEEGAQVIGRYADGGVACAAKSTPDGLRVYLGILHCPAGLLRNILKASNVPLYMDTDDVVLTDGRFLCVSATSEGVKTLLFPRKRTVKDAFDGEEIAHKVRSLELKMDKGETRTFELK